MKRITALLLTALLLLSLAACGGKGTWQEQYDLGMRYLNEGDYQEAVIAFTAAIEIDPKRPEAYIGRGDAYISGDETDKDFSAAIEDYKKALELNEKLPETYIKISDVYLAQGEFERAIECLRQGYNATKDELILDYLKKLEDPFVQEENFFSYSLFSEENQDYIESLYDTLKTEDLTKIRTFILKTGVKIGEIVKDTSPIYKYLEKTDGAERRQYFGLCSTCTIIDSGEKMRISCSWIENGGEIRDSTYQIEIHPKSGQGYYLYYIDYGEAYNLQYTTGQCKSWNWNGEYWGYLFDYVRPVEYIDQGGIYTTELYDGHYTTGMAEEGLVDGIEHTREVSWLEIGVDDPLVEGASIAEWHLTDGAILRNLQDGYCRTWELTCERGKVVARCEIERDGSRRQVELGVYEDILLSPSHAENVW